MPATACFADEQPAAAEAVRDRDGAQDEPQHRVRGWIGLLGGATEGAVGDIEEQGAEHVDDGFHALDQRHSGGDCDGAEQERTGDADDDHRPRSSGGTKKYASRSENRNTLSSESERSIR